MKILVTAMMLFSSATCYAFVGLPFDTCQALKGVAADMREEAKTGIPLGDTQWSANMECGGNVPYDQNAEVLTEYWNKCAEHYDQIYKENCNLR